MRATEGFPYKKRDRRRKSDRWYAVLTVNGRRQYHAATPNTRDGAKALLAELQRDRKAGVIDSRDLTLGQYLQSWLTTVRPSLAPATWKQHESIVRNHLGPVLGHARMSDLSVADIRAYLGRTRLDGQTLRHHRATLRRALADAVRDGRITRNVAALAEPPKLARKERPVLSADEARRLIDGTRDDRLWALWVLLVTTGMRSAEALGLQWGDVEVSHAGLLSTASDIPGAPQAGLARRRPRGGDEGVLRGISGFARVNHTLHWLDGQPVLMEPKTAKSRRTIPLTPIAVEALTAHRQRQVAAGGGRGLVFTTDRGLPLRGENLSPRLHKITDALGLPRVTVHDLRHSCATVLHGMGVPLEVIADLLGHSSTRITADLYRHRVPQLAVDAIGRMQEAIGGANSGAQTETAPW